MIVGIRTAVESQRRRLAGPTTAVRITIKAMKISVASSVQHSRLDETAVTYTSSDQRKEFLV